MVAVILDRPFEVRKPAANFRQQVTHLEGHLGMRLVDVVGRCLVCRNSAHELLLCIRRTVAPKRSVMTCSLPSVWTWYPARTAFDEAAATSAAVGRRSSHSR